MNKETTSIKPFNFDFAKCYYCGSKARHKSIITYYDKDKNVLGKVEAYVCSTCIERFTVKGDDYERSK